MADPVPDCGHYSPDEWMYLHSQCHPSDPTFTRVKGNTLIVECAVCEKTITTFILEMMEVSDGDDSS